MINEKNIKKIEKYFDEINEIIEDSHIGHYEHDFKEEKPFIWGKKIVHSLELMEHYGSKFKSEIDISKAIDDFMDAIQDSIGENADHDLKTIDLTIHEMKISLEKLQKARLVLLDNSKYEYKQQTIDEYLVKPPVKMLRKV